MTIDCWITEVAEEINDEEVNPDSKLYSKVLHDGIIFGPELDFHQTSA